MSGEQQQFRDPNNALEGSANLSPGAIGALVASSVLLAGCLVALVILLQRRKRQRQQLAVATGSGAGPDRFKFYAGKPKGGRVHRGANLGRGGSNGSGSDDDDDAGGPRWPEATYAMSTPRNGRGEV